MIETIEDFRKLIDHEVFLEPTGNRAIRWNGELSTATISKVGRSIITLSGPSFYQNEQRGKLHKNKLYTGNNNGWIAYRSEQDFIDKRQHEKISFAIRGRRNEFAEIPLADLIEAAKLLRVNP